MRLVLVLAQAACVPTVSLEVEGAASMIVALDEPGCEGGRCRFVEAIDGAKLPGFVAPADRTLHVLVYEVPLADLDLDEGILDYCAKSDEDLGKCPRHRPIPEPFAARSAQVGGEELADAEPPDELRTLRLFAFDPSDCFAGGGCLADLEGREPDLLDPDRNLYCKRPCEPNVPNPPALPVRPMMPSLSCPEGSEWRPATRDGIAACDPPPIPQCSQGQVSFFPDGNCAVVGGACPAGPWPNDIPPLAVFVDPNAPAGGVGTMLEPFQTIEEAYAVAPAGATLMLARGTSTWPCDQPIDLSVRGVCEESHLSFAGCSVLDVGAGVGLSSLTVDGPLRVRGPLCVQGVRFTGNGGGDLLEVHSPGSLDGEELWFDGGGLWVGSSALLSRVRVDAAMVTVGASVTIDRASIGGMVTFAGGSTASMSNAHVRGAVASYSSTLMASLVLAEPPPNVVAIQAYDGGLAVLDSTVRGVLQAFTSTVVLERVSVLDGFVDTSTTVISAEDLYIAPSSVGVVIRPTSRATLSRIHLAAPRGGDDPIGVVTEKSMTLVQDLVVSAGYTRGVVGDCGLRAERVAIGALVPLAEGGERIGLGINSGCSSPGPLRAFLTDLVIDEADTGVRALHGVEIFRAHMADVGIGVDLTEGAGAVVVDLSVAHSRAVAVKARGDIVIERALLDGAGIDATANLSATNISITGAMTALALGCENDVPTSFALARFDLRRSAIGVRFGACPAMPFTVEDGRIEAWTDVALESFGPFDPLDTRNVVIIPSTNTLVFRRISAGAESGP